MKDDTPHSFLSLRDIPRTRAVIVLHYYTTGPGQELHDWLRQRGAEESVLIEHPFIFSARAWARVDVCRKDSGCAERKLPRRRWPMAIRYALDFLRTIRLVLSLKGTYDLYVGNGCFDTVPGLILRRLGKVRTVVLYTIDYAPNAAGSRFHAWLYRRLDRHCCYRVNAIWDLSHRMMPARCVST